VSWIHCSLTWHFCSELVRSHWNSMKVVHNTVSIQKGCIGGTLYLPGLLWMALGLSFWIKVTEKVRGIIICLLALYGGHTCIDIRFGNFRFSPCSNGCMFMLKKKKSMDHCWFSSCCWYSSVGSHILQAR